MHFLNTLSGSDVDKNAVFIFMYYDVIYYFDIDVFIFGFFYGIGFVYEIVPMVIRV
jgi:hypothetical protein